MKNVLLYNILRIFLGLLFIFSGIIKLFPIESFEMHLVSEGLSSWGFSVFMARAIIIFEICLGIALIFNYYLKKITLPLIFLMLVVFTIYLSISLFRTNGNENCHCFGDLIPMSNLQSILKNLFMIAIAIFLFVKAGNRTFKIWKIILLCIIVSGTIFIIQPIQIYQLPAENKINTHASFDTIKGFYPDTLADLSKGEKLVAFLSLNCLHCKIMAQKLKIVNAKNNIPPVYVAFQGRANKILPFISETGISYPFTLLTNYEFFAHAGEEVPKLYLIKNGIIIKEWSGSNFNPHELELLYPEINFTN